MNLGHQSAHDNSSEEECRILLPVSSHVLDPWSLDCGMFQSKLLGHVDVMNQPDVVVASYHEAVVEQAARRYSLASGDGALATD